MSSRDYSQRKLAEMNVDAGAVGDLWERAKGLLKKVEEKIIKTVQDFADVARQNGFVLIGDTSGGVQSMMIEADIVKEDTFVCDECGYEKPLKKSDDDKWRTDGTLCPKCNSTKTHWAGEHISTDVEHSEKSDAYNPKETGPKALGDIPAIWKDRKGNDLLPEARMMMACKQELSSGNLKLDAEIGVWDLPCYKTCPESTEFCRKFCYAKKAEGQYDAPLKTRVKKYLTSLEGGFVDRMVDSIKQVEFQIVRVHGSGDFYDEKYFKKWIEIAKRCPETQFFAFTKAYKTLEGLKDKPDNFEFLGSAEVDTEVTIQPYTVEKMVDTKGQPLMEPAKDRQGNPKVDKQGQPIMKQKTKQVNKEKERRLYRGSSPEKIKSFLNNPNISGLAMIIPTGSNIEEVLEVLGVSDTVKPKDVFICPYKATGGCGEGQKLLFGKDKNPILDENGEQKWVEMCPFCWQSKEIRMNIWGARHVAFHQH